MSRHVMRPLLAALVVASSFGAGGTASACYGTSDTARVCPQNGVIYEDCVYTGGETCEQVDVTGPNCVVVYPATGGSIGIGNCAPPP